MPWANLDDKMPGHPKVIRLSDAAFRLHISGICYVAEHTTDGLIDADVVPMLAPRFKPRSLLELIDRQVWIKHGDVYEIHDYLQWNRSKAQIEQERVKRQKAGRKGAANRWGQP